MTADDPTLAFKAIVARAQKGDAAAFASLVQSAHRPVYGLCLRLLRSEAEAAEIAQEAFLRAYRHLHRYDAERPFDVWMLAIARNLCLDVLRRRSHMKTEDLEHVGRTLPSADATLEERAIANEERLSLEAAMATLSPDERTVLALYYVNKRTTKEIAAVMGVAPGTIMARLFRAREKLRKRMSLEQAK